jgi:hypothetical protein
LNLNPAFDTIWPTDACHDKFFYLTHITCINK